MENAGNYLIDWLSNKQEKKRIKTSAMTQYIA